MAYIGLLTLADKRISQTVAAGSGLGPAILPGELEIRVVSF